MSRILTLIALALATAAVAASVAGADTGAQARTTVDPLAVSYLIGQGLTPSRGRVLDRRRLLQPEEGRVVLRDARPGHSDGRPARSQLPDRAGPHPERGRSPGPSATAPTRPRPRRATRCSRKHDPAATVDPLAVSYLTGAGSHPERGDVLDGRRLLARGQGQLLLRDVRADRDRHRPRRSASAGATRVSVPSRRSESFFSSAASAPASSPVTTGVTTPLTHDPRVSHVRVELPSYSEERAGLRARPLVLVGVNATRTRRVKEREGTRGNRRFPASGILAIGNLR